MAGRSSNQISTLGDFIRRFSGVTQSDEVTNECGGSKGIEQVGRQTRTDKDRPLSAIEGLGGLGMLWTSLTLDPAGGQEVKLNKQLWALFLVKRFDHMHMNQIWTFASKSCSQT